MTNWRGMQSVGCLKPLSFTPPKDIKAKYLHMGSWKANLHQDGKKHVPHHGRA